MARQSLALTSRVIARHLGGERVAVGILRRRASLTLTAFLQPRPVETSPNAEVRYESVSVRELRRRVIVTRRRLLRNKGGLKGIRLLRRAQPFQCSNSPIRDLTDGCYARPRRLSAALCLTSPKVLFGDLYPVGNAFGAPESAGWTAHVRSADLKIT